jgi:hypothetical protein
MASSSLAPHMLMFFLILSVGYGRLHRREGAPKSGEIAHELRYRPASPVHQLPTTHEVQPSTQSPLVRADYDLGAPVVRPDYFEAVSKNTQVSSDGDCEPVSTKELASSIERAAKRYEVNPGVILAVMFQESRFHSCAVSPKGAKGLMQLMPQVIRQYSVSDPFDPSQNIDAGTRLLRELIVRFDGDLRLVFAAYNAGPAAVDRAGGEVPDILETQRYTQSLNALNYPLGALTLPRSTGQLRAITK